jgi:uncharacterized protein YbcI
MRTGFFILFRGNMETQEVTKIELEENVRVFVKQYFSDQMGENISSVQTFIHNSMLIIIAKDCFHASEMELVRNKLHLDQLLEYKTLQFNKVQAIFQRRLEVILKREITKLDTITEQHGVRYIFITFGKSIE